MEMEERREYEQMLTASCPFDDECRRNYQVGRMDMLFNLADLGVVRLDLAASLAGMDIFKRDKQVFFAGGSSI